MCVEGHVDLFLLTGPKGESFALLSASRPRLTGDLIIDTEQNVLTKENVLIFFYFYD